MSRARNGDGPTLLVCDTYRFRGHYEGDDRTYRTSDEVEKWGALDPIIRLKNKMNGEGLLTERGFKEIEGSVSNEIEEAVEFADKSPWPSPTEVLEDIYTSL